MAWWDAPSLGPGRRAAHAQAQQHVHAIPTQDGGCQGTWDDDDDDDHWFALADALPETSGDNRAMSTTTDPIVRDPDLLEGQATFAGTRVPYGCCSTT